MLRGFGRLVILWLLIGMQFELRDEMLEASPLIRGTRDELRIARFKHSVLTNTAEASRTELGCLHRSKYAWMPSSHASSVAP